LSLKIAIHGKTFTPDTKALIEKLWVDIGGKIYADATTELSHFGGHAFKGSLSMMFKPKPVDLTIKS
jgi:hypothetical protein